MVSDPAPVSVPLDALESLTDAALRGIGVTGQDVETIREDAAMFIEISRRERKPIACVHVVDAMEGDDHRAIAKGSHRQRAHRKEKRRERPDRVAQTHAWPASTWN